MNLNQALASPGRVDGDYNSGNLPSATLYPVGTTVATVDKGTLYSNGSTWQSTPPTVGSPAPGGGLSSNSAGLVLSPANASITNRLPAVTDNATAGYTTASLWQYNGSVYNTAAYCAADAASWQQSYLAVGGGPVDVMGTTLTKFAGGTVAMMKGFTGAAIDVAAQIAGVWQISTVNILTNGELDNVTLGGILAQADANTVVRVLKLYDQTGNGFHATLGNAVGIPVVVNATVTTSTTLTVNSVTSGTVVIGQLVFGNGITVGTTIASGAGPYTLSTGSPTNPGPEIMYLGISTCPYVDWDPTLGRYVILATRTGNATTDRRALQFPQSMTVTSNQNLGVFAVGVGAASSDGSGPCLCTVGDGLLSTNYFAIFGSAASPSSKFGMISAGSGGGSSMTVAMVMQPAVFTISTTNTTTTCNVNESVATAAAFTNLALAGGWIFTYGGASFAPYAMMKLAGLAIFNSGPTAAQTATMRRAAYARFNIYPQVQNQVALIGDSRFTNNLVIPGFGTSDLLPRYLGRGWNCLNLAISGSTTQAQIGDGLVPTVTGVAKALQTLKGPGLNYAVVLIGVNDFYVNSSTVAATLGYLQTLCAQITAAGWTPILISELAASVTNGSNPSILLPILHAAIQAAGAAGMNAAALVNLYGYTPVTTPANTSYYYDGLHPTVLVHQICAAAVAAAMVQLGVA